MALSDWSWQFSKFARAGILSVALVVSSFDSEMFDDLKSSTLFHAILPTLMGSYIDHRTFLLDFREKSGMVEYYLILMEHERSLTFEVS